MATRNPTMLTRGNVVFWVALTTLGRNLGRYSTRVQVDESEQVSRSAARKMYERRTVRSRNDDREGE